MSPAPVFVRIPGSHHPGIRLRLIPGFRDPGSVLILGQVTQYGNPYLICITNALYSRRNLQKWYCNHSLQPAALITKRTWHVLLTKHSAQLISPKYIPITRVLTPVNRNELEINSQVLCRVSFVKQLVKWRMNEFTATEREIVGNIP